MGSNCPTLFRTHNPGYTFLFERRASKHAMNPPAVSHGHGALEASWSVEPRTGSMTSLLLQISMGFQPNLSGGISLCRTLFGVPCAIWGVLPSQQLGFRPFLHTQLRQVGLANPSCQPLTCEVIYLMRAYSFSRFLVVPLLPLGEGSPTKIDYRKKWVPLFQVLSGGPSFEAPWPWSPWLSVAGLGASTRLPWWAPATSPWRWPGFCTPLALRPTSSSAARRPLGTWGGGVGGWGR